MEQTLTAESLAKVRYATESLSVGCSNPRTVEANMDILCTALTDLGLIPISPERRFKIDLCEALEGWVKKGLVDPIAVRCCQGIEELIQVSDYDISDFDEFEAETIAEIEVLKEELENAYARLEKQIAEDANG